MALLLDFCSILLCSFCEVEKLVSLWDEGLFVSFFLLRLLLPPAQAFVLSSTNVGHSPPFSITEVKFSLARVQGFLVPTFVLPIQIYIYIQHFAYRIVVLLYYPKTIRLYLENIQHIYFILVISFHGTERWISSIVLGCM